MVGRRRRRPGEGPLDALPPCGRKLICGASAQAGGHMDTCGAERGWGGGGEWGVAVNKNTSKLLPPFFIATRANAASWRGVLPPVVLTDGCV